MLSKLYIENIAVIQKAELQFENGMNVLTGETGAGKSILINSIMAVLGERTSRELIRTGATSAFVSAEFTSLGRRAKENLKALGIDPDCESIVISRDLKADGKASFRINGRPYSAAILREAGRFLINIHGQHDSQSLLDPDNHLGYIDAISGDKACFEKYSAAYSKLTELSAQLRKVAIDESEKARKIDLLQYQINDITTAKLRVGEYEELMTRREYLRNFEGIREALYNVINYIDGDDNVSGAADLVNQSCSELGRINISDASLEAVSQRMTNLRYELEDCSYDLREFFNSMSYDPEELEKIEDRIDLLKKIIKKYGGEEEALHYLEDAKSELAEIELSDERRAQLTAQLEKQRLEARNCAVELTKSRRLTAKHFSELVKSELAFLEMPSVVFSVEINPKELSENGADNIEFLISANPGEAPKPLAKIASGGELSRIMLAIKNVLAENDDIDTLIFDEVDSGVSGKAAQKIGIKLKESSRYRQIICVTHLAQIAAFADNHLFICKEVHDGRTFTSVVPLSYEQRVTELARINGGENISRALLDSSREMLDTALKYK